MKQRDASSPLLFNFALEYAIRKVQETNLGLDMNGTHQVLAYADMLLNACKDIGSAVNTGKTKYMEIGRHQGMIANVHIL